MDKNLKFLFPHIFFSQIVFNSDIVEKFQDDRQNDKNYSNILNNFYSIITLLFIILVIYLIFTNKMAKFYSILAKLYIICMLVLILIYSFGKKELNFFDRIGNLLLLLFIFIVSLFVIVYIAAIYNLNANNYFTTTRTIIYIFIPPLAIIHIVYSLGIRGMTLCKSDKTIKIL